MMDLDAITKIAQDFDRMVPKNTLAAISNNSALEAVKRFDEQNKAFASSVALAAKLNPPPAFHRLNDGLKLMKGSPVFDLPKMDFPQLTALQKAADSWRMPLNGILKQSELAMASHNQTLAAIAEGFKPLTIPTPNIVSAISSLQKDFIKISAIAQVAAASLALNHETIAEALKNQPRFVQDAAERLTKAEVEATIQPSPLSKAKLEEVRNAILWAIFWMIIGSYVFTPSVNHFFGEKIESFYCPKIPTYSVMCPGHPLQIQLKLYQERLEQIEKSKNRTERRLDHLERQQKKDRAINRLRHQKKEDRK